MNLSLVGLINRPYLYREPSHQGGEKKRGNDGYTKEKEIFQHGFLTLKNRRYARGTSAHNTVTLDDLEQAELWKSFRVARRGYPQGFKVVGEQLQCSHNGFSIWQKGLFHKRIVVLRNNGVELQDHVEGRGTHSFKAFFHFAPGIDIKREGEGYRVEEHLFLEPWGAVTQLKESQYYPEFGLIQDRPCLVLEGRFSGHGVFGLRCIYSS